MAKCGGLTCGVIIPACSYYIFQAISHYCYGHLYTPYISILYLYWVGGIPICTSRTNLVWQYVSGPDCPPKCGFQCPNDLSRCWNWLLQLDAFLIWDNFESKPHEEQKSKRSAPHLQLLNAFSSPVPSSQWPFELSIDWSWKILSGNHGFPPVKSRAFLKRVPWDHHPFEWEFPF